MWLKKKNNKTDTSLVKNKKCIDCEDMFIPLDILTKEGKSLCNNCFIKEEEK